ncbi:DUF1343 domain-containing protein [Saccharothrix violaceirubra]|uniref:Uncharacterized protein YbbC (DUF1343 family) n=1 Tax=Saccharothrix violaceirubra TaxID=413306 RepID=A0A7W7WZJ7_9PSEU|nr:uncharacterized protein YbbC (DUF1343 family) [Saccharothrix violaceirubra]
MIGRREVLFAAVTVPAAGLAPASTAGAEAAAVVATGRRVVTGADVLAADHWRGLEGRVAVLGNPTAVLRDGVHVVDSMVAAGVPPVVVLGPEHGFRGTAQAGGSEGDHADPRTGIKVRDVYRADAAKFAGVLREERVDVLVFDIADVGARFYTYIWTMLTAMTAAASVGARFVVLDRPNPLGGKAKGPQLLPGFASGVGVKPVVQQHGLTVGELAGLFAGEFLDTPLDLDVVEVRHWRRDDLDTGLAWVPPSPNMPTRDTALVYPGTCLFEGTSFTEGRGTTKPFETVGSPDVDWRWAEDLNGERLPGVRFRETYFAPAFGRYAGRTCGGVQLQVTNAREFDAVRTGVAMIVTAARRYPFAWREDNWVDLLFGSDRLRRMVDARAGIDDIVGSWRQELDEFDRTRKPYSRYR